MQSLFESLPNGLTLSNYDDWLSFDARLSELVRTGQARRVQALRVLHMPDEEWYVDPSTGEVYVYVKPDDKILPKWEPVDVFAQSEKERNREPGLSAIPVKKMNCSEAASLKEILKVLVRHGVAEVLDRPNTIPAVSPESAETWYRDIQTKAVFRLVESTGDESSRWEKVPPNQEEWTIQ